MATSAQTYCDYATGNDYKGATFTDGAFTHATLNLQKTGAFTANQINHWLYLADNSSGKIVPGYYKIATKTDNDNVILATDPSVGHVDATDVKCIQADGTTSKPWRSIQGALDLLTKDATNGDQVNIKAGAIQVLQAAIVLTRYGGTYYDGAWLTFSGYTTASNDGGVAEVDGGGFTFIAGDPANVVVKYVKLHSFGNANFGIKLGSNGYIWRCEIHKGVSSPASKWAFTMDSGLISECVIHDIGNSTMYGILGGMNVENCYFYNINGIGCAPTGRLWNCVFYNCNVGIQAGFPSMVWNNSIHAGTFTTGTGINVSGGPPIMIYNNIIEGYSGVGGKGIYSASKDIFGIGYNTFFNNATPVSFLGDIYNDWRSNDVTASASPFVNPAGGDFALNPLVSGAIENGRAQTIYFLSTTASKLDRGTAQRGAGAGGSVSISPFRGNIG